MNNKIFIYKLKNIWEDPRYEGFGCSRGAIPSFIERDKTTGKLQILRRSLAWTPVEVSGRVRKYNDFPCVLLQPAFSQRAVDALRDMLELNGEILPLKSPRGSYYLYNTTTLVDVFDRSQLDNPMNKIAIEYYEFYANRLDGLSIFRIPEYVTATFVTEAFATRVRESGLNGFDLVRVWPLPDGVKWRVLHEEECKKRKAKELSEGPDRKGNTVIVRLANDGEEFSEEDRNYINAMIDRLADLLVDFENMNPLIPEVGHFEENNIDTKGECRLIVSCPDTNALLAKMSPWFKSLKWPKGITVFKLNGNYKTPGVRQEQVAIDGLIEGQKSHYVTSVSEKPMNADTLASIKACANDALGVLGIGNLTTNPEAVITAIDEFVYQWQKGKRPSAKMLTPDDAPLVMGSLWGEEITKCFGWQWAMIGFPNRGNSSVPAVASPDRSLVIYPIHFLTGCFRDSGVDVTVLLAHNMQVNGKIPALEPRKYFNLMEGVRRKVPRK